MGTHPIFESDFDCLTECPSDHHSHLVWRQTMTKYRFHPTKKILVQKCLLSDPNVQRLEQRDHRLDHLYLPNRSDLNQMTQMKILVPHFQDPLKRARSYQLIFGKCWPNKIPYTTKMLILKNTVDPLKKLWQKIARESWVMILAKLSDQFYLPKNLMRKNSKDKKIIARSD